MGAKGAPQRDPLPGRDVGHAVLCPHEWPEADLAVGLSRASAWCHDFIVDWFVLDLLGALQKKGEKGDKESWKREETCRSTVGGLRKVR